MNKPFITYKEENEQLRDKVRELEEENARLKAECDDIKQVQFPRKLEAVAIGWKKQLAASQAYAEQLRVALETLNKVSNIGCDRVEKALALPHSTSALDAYVAEKVKEAMK